MMMNRYRLAIIIVISGILLSLCRIEVAHAFITREYTLQEVLDACSNVAFGTTESVDQRRKRVIVKLEENSKGRSEFSQIKINVAVGQRTRGTSPNMLMKKFKVGLPVIIFYQREGNSLNGLGYVSGTWFQISGNNRRQRNRVWWEFTHIEIHMHRTFTGTTEAFQKVIRATLSGKKWPTAREGDVKVLVLTGNSIRPLQGVVPGRNLSATVEYLALRKINRVDERGVVYQQTKDRNLAGLGEAHILWIGVDEIGMDGYLLRKKAEDKIKSFVQNGGVVIVSSQDSDPGRLCGNGWIPEPITGVEEAARQDFKPTKHAGDIFSKPRRVRSGSVHLDDTWTGWSSKYKILATTNSGKNIALAMLPYGKGMYLVTALQNESERHIRANAPLIENIIHFSVKWLGIRD